MQMPSRALSSAYIAVFFLVAALRSAIAFFERRPCLNCAAAILARPSAVLGPVLAPPCKWQRPFCELPARWQTPPERVFALHSPKEWNAIKHTFHAIGSLD